MFKSLPLTIREIKATESRLQAIYDAAALGLKGDALALAAGMLPQEYRRLCQLDPVAELAAQKGKADAEAEMAGHLREAARQGDSKAALEILKHAHDWTAKQAVSIDVNQTISITAALQAAEQRVIDYIEAPKRANAPGLLTKTSTQEVEDGYAYSNARTPERVTEL
jgi:hypothetical protein